MKVYERPQALYPTFPRKGGAEPAATHYCPGCGHGIVHKLLGEVIDELELGDRSIIISPVGCSVFAYYYFNAGNVQAAHGRAPAVATGIKRSRPESVVVSYQGDGDLAAIGGNNILQAANRGENFTVVFINNAIYGMTGGQLAPTSLLGMRTTTTPEGRSFEDYGGPIRVAELLAPLDGVAYSARHALFDAKQINQTRKALKKALEYQRDGRGFSLVEILSQCPTGWKQDPVDSLEWVRDQMVPTFPLGTFKDQPHDPIHPPHPARYQAPEVEEIVHSLPTIQPPDDAPVRPDRLPLNIKAAGFGGQGILLLGELLAKCGLSEGLSVTWLPSYGPEMRGGTANCSVVVDDGTVGSPLVEHPNFLIAMNRPSLERFEPEVEPDGVILYDSSLIDIAPTREDVQAFPVEATRIADGIGSNRFANVVMLGAAMALLGFPAESRREPLLAAISKTDSILDGNRQALAAGIDAMRTRLTT